MVDFTPRYSISFPEPDDHIKHADSPAKLAEDIRSTAVTAEAAITDLEGRSVKMQHVHDLSSLNVEDWHGSEMFSNIYRAPAYSVVQQIEGRPYGTTAPAIIELLTLGSGGTVVRWTEYQAPHRVWQKVVSSTAANRTPWQLQTPPTRTALHQLSMPGNTARVDDAPARHVRLPIKFFVTVNTWELVFKNFNDQFSRNYGRLDFTDVYLGERAKDANGNYTANFVPGTKINLGTPQLLGVDTDAERYSIWSIHYQLEANKEYIISYGYTNQDGNVSHLGFGGSYIGTTPSNVGSDEDASPWSPNTPLDVYIKPEISFDTPFYAYPGSSSETGNQADYPLRDVWTWRHAEANKAVPAQIGHSGTTLERYISTTNYVRRKWSTVAKADKIIGNPGSNDIYSGESLATVQNRYVAFVAWLRRWIGETIEAADIFPRATETQAVRDVRLAFNAWLKSLPDNILACHSRAHAVTGPDGTMNPIYDADGVHLNTAGQRIMGAAVILGGSTAAGATVDTSVGTRVFVGDTMIYGDTGRRDIRDSSVNPDDISPGGRAWIQRTGNRVHISLYDINLANSGTLRIADVPAGFRPIIREGYIVSISGTEQLELIVLGGSIYIYNVPGSLGRIRATLSWSTENAWPTSLPGTPA